jgi:diguanylate cyclase (GGDEF)-like protein
MATARAKPSPALALARRAWQSLHLDSARSIELADRALTLAEATADRSGHAWARLARGFHGLYFATPEQAAAELREARSRFESLGERAGELLAATGLARARWRAGEFEAALDAVLPLRDEGLRVLRHEQRGVLLNTIAGCWSAQGRSDLAFAYMFEALRDAGPTRGRGFDVVLHCNLAHELLQIGDHGEALRHVDLGLARCAGLNNPRLLSVLLLNRIISLTELGRAEEALPDIVRVRDLPATAAGRGVAAPGHETLAIAALRAGETMLGAELIAQARSPGREPLPDERIEIAVAQALLAFAQGHLDAAQAPLDAVYPMADAGTTAGLSLRLRCLYFLVRSEWHERRGEAALALAALRRWQALNGERALLASAARYQAAALQTELLRLQHQVEEHDAKRRTTEKARAELAVINTELQRKVAEVQALQGALREQATRDTLTGLFNRRHLNDTLPAMWALAQRDGEPLAVAIIDLDHFKRVNDDHGHASGDRLLADFGALLARSIRKSDVACRWGGEEFCILLPRTDAEAARRKVAALLKRWRGASGFTFSAGVCDSRRVGGSPERLLQAADEELLAAKRAGRNRVLAAAAPP